MLPAAASSTRCGVIDIGTNSVKLLVADVAGETVEPVWEGSEQTRLGRGFYEDHRLRADAIADTARAAAQFTKTAREQGASALRIIATSAARDAVNADELLCALREATGHAVEVISGEQEADWAFQGVLTDVPLRAAPLLILDVGGGSTEFILGHQGRALFRDSFKLGTVRLLEATPLADPPAAEELAALRRHLRAFLQREVEPRLEPHLQPLRGDGLALVGTGGTTSILARLELQLPDYDRARIEATHFTAARVRAHVDRLWALPLAARKELPGLPAKRADVILFGVAIFEAVMETFGIATLRVSTRGLRFAAVRPGPANRVR
ncbi:MAG: phosphatase [Pedosphaera sp. Tous-C6FEB]|nr:MAG: phosphatase [Pedosphaera sp. Tous-C6FEB]